MTREDFFLWVIILTVFVLLLSMVFVTGFRADDACRERGFGGASNFGWGGPWTPKDVNCYSARPCDVLCGGRQ